MREVAKFACEAEVFHAFAHGVLGFSGTTVTVFGITPTPTWNFIAAIVNGLIALVLGLYGWNRPSDCSTRP